MIPNNFKNIINKQELFLKTALLFKDKEIKYDDSYEIISFPNGDIPSNKGVCTDLIVRVFRKAFNWDLQESIFKFRQSLNLKTDTNIDHRRVIHQIEYFDYLVDKSILKNNLSEFIPGNIIVNDRKDFWYHIAIYIGNGNIIHFSSTKPRISNLNTDVKIIRNYSFVQ